MDPTCAAPYKSPSQIVRVISEQWGAQNLFCVACNQNRLSETPANTKAFDYYCADCETRYQLKSTKRIGSRVMDSAYEVMIASIRSDSAPHMLVLNYSESWSVQNLFMIPSICLTESAIIKRKPLSPDAERKDWVGCDVNLREINPNALLHIVRDGDAITKRRARAEFELLMPTRRRNEAAKGWTRDVLEIVSELQTNFTLSDVYRFEPELKLLHPNNRHIKDKIRQQLQLLRDCGVLKFVSDGNYKKLL